MFWMIWAKTLEGSPETIMRIPSRSLEGKHPSLGRRSPITVSGRTPNLCTPRNQQWTPPPRTQSTTEAPAYSGGPLKRCQNHSTQTHPNQSCPSVSKTPKMIFIFPSIQHQDIPKRSSNRNATQPGGTVFHALCDLAVLPSICDLVAILFSTRRVGHLGLTAGPCGADVHRS